MLVVPLLVLVGLPYDLAAQGLQRTLVFALPARLVFFGLGLYQRSRLTQMTRLETIERSVTVLQALLFALFYYFVAVTFFSYSEHVLVTLFVVLTAYLIFPNRFVVMVRLGILGSIGYVATVLVFVGVDGTLLTLMFQSLVVANVFGAITAHRLHVAKRREYLRLIEHRDLNEELRGLNVELEALATTDSLTGINNRRNFFRLATDEMARARRYQRPLSALMMDVDGFKIVNDQHGHAVGDSVLKAVIQTCITTLRETDILGRLGGDEFAVLVPETEDARDQAERLRAAVERVRTALADGTDLTVTVSIGVAAARPEDLSIDDLLGRADQALYEAKQNGRNSVAAA